MYNLIYYILEYICICTLTIIIVIIVIAIIIIIIVIINYYYLSLLLLLLLLLSLLLLLLSFLLSLLLYIWSKYGVQKIVRHCKTSSLRIQAAAVAEVVPTSSSSELWCPALILEVRQDRAVSLITCNFWLAKLGVVRSWQPWSWRNQQRIKGSKDQRIKGSKDQRIKRSNDQRIKGSKDQRIKGSKASTCECQKACCKTNAHCKLPHANCLPMRLLR